MKNVIIYTNETGGVSICMPTGEIPIEQVQSRDIPGNIQSYIISADILPEEHSDFYNAWEQTKGVVTVNLEKARAITKDRLRTERAPLIQAQDVLYMRALEQGQDTTAIVAEKSRLRDITTLADSATTLDELRALRVAL
jgi:hypothetical protein